MSYNRCITARFSRQTFGESYLCFTFANGRIIGHTLVFVIALLMISLCLYNKKKDVKILSLATGTFFHLMEDQMWSHPLTLFWPLLGLYFPKGNIDETGLESFLRMLESSFHPEFSFSFVPEI